MGWRLDSVAHCDGSRHLTDADTSVKCSTQEQKAEAELSRVWTKPRLSWNLSATLHKFVSFSNVNSTSAKYIRITTSMLLFWNATARYNMGQYFLDMHYFLPCEQVVLNCQSKE